MPPEDAGVATHTCGTEEVDVAGNSLVLVSSDGAQFAREPRKVLNGGNSNSLFHKPK